MGGGISLTSTGNCFKKELIEATKIFGKNNLLVLKSESMLTSKEKLKSLNQIQQFIFPQNSLEQNQDQNQNQMNNNKDWFKTQSQQIYRVNSGKLNENRGEKNVIHLGGGKEEEKDKNEVESEDEDGRYEISKFKPMLKETRKIIYQRWKEECLWIYKQYEILYPACQHNFHL